MSIYFVSAGRYFKIGYAEDAQRRFENLHKSGTRYTFPADTSWKLADRTLYRVVDGDQSRELHIHLALDRFSVGLEWFLNERPVRDFIDALPESDDRWNREVLPEVARPGGWCDKEYLAVQEGRAERELARYVARRSA